MGGSAVALAAVDTFGRRLSFVCLCSCELQSMGGSAAALAGVDAFGRRLLCVSWGSIHFSVLFPVRLAMFLGGCFVPCGTFGTLAEPSESFTWTWNLAAQSFTYFGPLRNLLHPCLRTFQNLSLQPLYLESWNLVDSWILYAWNLGTFRNLYLEPLQYTWKPPSAPGPSLAEAPKLSAVWEQRILIQITIIVFVSSKCLPVFLDVLSANFLIFSIPHHTQTLLKPHRAGSPKACKSHIDFYPGNSQPRALFAGALCCECEGEAKSQGFKLTEGSWSLQPHSQSDSCTPWPEVFPSTLRETFPACGISRLTLSNPSWSRIQAVGAKARRWFSHRFVWKRSLLKQNGVGSPWPRQSAVKNQVSGCASVSPDPGTRCQSFPTLSQQMLHQSA